ncbi:MAG TPA: pitrilysin family protein [Usitatibacter sp.]|nr:pitrilysin family protein [Usitatibacter sp.]
MVLRIASLLLPFVFASAALAAGDTATLTPIGARLPKGIAKVTSVEGITEYRVESNGLKVLLFPDASKATTTVNVTYLVGSRMENYGETGMAHLLEHLMFKGTPKHPHIDQEFNQRGARFNGTTSMDRTNYYEIAQASDDNLAWAIELEADRMVHSNIARKDLDSEMTVVRNEYEQGENSPFAVLLKRMQSVMYDWHSYGRSTIGNKSDIENVRIENLQAFYHLYYQPDNAVLLIAGKFDEAKALALVAKHFGAIPRPKRKLPAFWTVEPTQDGDRSFTVRRKGDIQAVILGYHVPSNLHDDSDGLGFASFVLGQVPAGRLHKALVEKGLAAQVFSFPLMGVDPGMMYFGAVVKKGDDVEPVRAELTKIVEGFAAAPPEEQEMARARLAFGNQAEKTLANSESVGVQMSEYIALGDWRLFFQARDTAQKVTPQQVQDVAKRYFVRDNRTTGIFLPEDNPRRAEIPASPTVAEVMKDFKAKEAGAAGEAFDPSQDNIDRRTHHLQFGDVKVALLPKKTRGETVNVSMSLHLGNEKALFGQQMNSSLAARMLNRGTTKYTRTQLSDEYERLKVSGRVSGPGAAFQTTRPNLEGALRLAAHVLRNPSFPQSEYDQLVNQTVTGITASLSEPEALASDALSKHFNTYPKGDWRYASSLQESLDDVKAAKLDEVKKYYQQFYGASPAEIAIVGDFDEASVVALLKELFGDWKPVVPYQRVPVEYKDVPPMDQAIATPDKENAVLLARENLDMRDDDPDFAALYVADYVMGGGAGFDSRLTARIRQKEGLSYGVGSGLSVDSQDRAASWSVYAIAAPQNMSKVVSAMREEIDRALRDGFTDAEIVSAKSGILQARVQNRAQDGTLAGAWVANMHLGRTFQWSKDFEAKVLALTPAQVSAAFRKYVDPKRLSIVTAGDFKGTSAKLPQ